MNRDEFMRELEYLLADIPDEEKEDAIEYYRDYLEEAGPENEDSVIREFGSPERIAAMIRADMNGHLKEGGEFTESGYQDERFRDPNYQMAKRYDLPEVTEQPEKDSGFYKQESEPVRKRRGDNRRTIKIILWIVLIIAASPMLFWHWRRDTGNFGWSHRSAVCSGGCNRSGNVCIPGSRICPGGSWFYYHDHSSSGRNIAAGSGDTDSWPWSCFVGRLRCILWKVSAVSVSKLYRSV